MTTTGGQPQPHTMHLQVNPKTQLPMTTTEGQLQPHIMHLRVNVNAYELPRKSFKTEVHNMLLSLLASEDIYIESPPIIWKIMSTSPQ